MVEIAGLQTVLINLERSQRRRQQMEERLAKLGLPYRIFPAVDGAKEKERLFRNVDLPAFRRNVGRDVLPGEIGAYHSHVAVWEQFVAGDAEVLLVLEDDVVFGDDFIEALQCALATRAHWDFLKLNKIRAKQPIAQGSIGRYVLNAYAGPATGLGAYLINRRTAARLAAAFWPIRRPIDHELDRIYDHDFRHLGLEPFPSHVADENESTITGTSFSQVRNWAWYRRLPMYGGRVVNTARKLLHLFATGQLFPKRRTLAAASAPPPVAESAAN
jgi:glycosyl transferase family 25